jgi:hypothetical protein
MKQKSNMVRLAAVLTGLLLFMQACSISGPVDGDYFSTEDRIRGGQQPTPPSILSLTLSGPDSLIISFSSAGAVDPDSGANEGLYYFLYLSKTNPRGFGSEAEYYSFEHYLNYVAESDFSADPKELSLKINPDYTGNAFFWMTSYDGGRESIYSEQPPAGPACIHIPDGAACSH